MNILTDVLSLIKRKQFIKELKPYDVIVVGIHEEPEITGIASPIPYKNVKLIKAADLAVKFDSCDFINIPDGDTNPGVFKNKTTDPETGECVVNLRRLKSLSLNLSIQTNGDYIEFNTTAEPNSAENIDCGGVGVYADKVGETLRFKSLLSPDGSIQITDNSNCIELTSTAAADLYVENTAFVDSTYGDDTTGEVENASKPFATGLAAQAAVTSGQTVVFRPGVHIVSGLGKDGVNYHLEEGCKLYNNTTGNLFTDGGIAITYNVYGSGEVETDAGRIIYNNNVDTVCKFSVSSIKQNTFGSTRDTIWNQGTLYINVEGTVDINADRYYFIQNWTQATCYFKANFVKVRTMVFLNRGRMYYTANYTESFVTDANENSFGSANNPDAYALINGGYIRLDNGSGAWTSPIAPTIGTLEFVGCIIKGTSDIRPMIDVGDVSNGGGTVILNNCTVEVEDSVNLPIVIVRSNVNNRFIARNTEFINRNTSTISGGIQIENVVPGGSVELTNCTFKLSTTAVAAGAKAIRDTSGSAEYKMYTDILSNGAFEGTNLISHTAGFIDPNCKSD